MTNEFFGSNTEPDTAPAEEIDEQPGHELSIAELRDFATEKGVDLGTSSRKADIKAALFEGLNVADLREFARRNGTDLRGANSRAAIIQALSGEKQESDGETRAVYTRESLAATPVDQIWELVKPYGMSPYGTSLKEAINAILQRQ